MRVNDDNLLIELKKLIKSTKHTPLNGHSLPTDSLSCQGKKGGRVRAVFASADQLFCSRLCSLCHLCRGLWEGFAWVLKLQ
jgi:hypothetical protein